MEKKYHKSKKVTEDKKQRYLQENQVTGKLVRNLLDGNWTRKGKITSN